LHPFGYGKELYFWCLIVAVLIFGVGGGISIYEGIKHLLHPAPLEDPTWSYVVLGLAAVFEAIVFVIAFRAFQSLKGETESFWQAIKNSKDPTTFTVLFEDAAALLGLIVAFVGIYLAHYFNNPYLDGAASVAIGLILSSVALLLVYESKGLLVGEGADAQTLENIRKLAEAEKGVKKVINPLTMYFGPHTILLTVDIEFDADLSAAEVEETVDRLEKNIRGQYPDIKHIYIEAGAISASSREATSSK
jgi:cation diffusion facilitator family transporter